VLSHGGEHAAVLLATHQTEDVAALCDRVIVLVGGQVKFDGDVRVLVDSARGRVWLSEAPGKDAQVSWRTGTGQYRSVGGRPPRGAEETPPTLEDAYLLLVGSASAVEVAA
jgi:ABC-2 type transport system ATP-binding protein